MDNPNFNITTDFYQYFNAWSYVSVPSVYTNLLSYYEVIGKLIPSLEELQKTQNLTSAQMDSLVAQVLPYLEMVRDYLVKWRASIVVEWDKFRQNRIDYENNYKIKLKQTYDIFIAQLKEMEANYLKEFNTYWSNNTTILSGTLDNAYTNLVNKGNQILNNMLSWYTNYKDNVNNNLSITKNKYIELDKNVELWYTNFLQKIKEWHDNYLPIINDFKTNLDHLYNINEEEWERLVREFYNKYKDSATNLVNNANFMEFIIKMRNEIYNEFQYPNKALFKIINYVGPNEPDNPQIGEVWLYINTRVDVETIKSYTTNDLKIYTEDGFIPLYDDNLYMDQDYHVYYPTTKLIDTLTEEISTPTGSDFNPSAWYIPVGYQYLKGVPYVISLQQYSSACYMRTRLDYGRHSYSYCASNRGFGAYNLIYHNINNDFQRILTLTNGYICLQNGKGIFVGGKELNNFEPNPYANVCDDEAEEPIFNESGYKLVTGLYHVSVPIIYQEVMNSYYLYNIEQKMLYQLPFNTMPRFTYKDNLYFINTITGEVGYINTKNGATKYLNWNKFKDIDTLQINDDETYIYSNKEVYKIIDEANIKHVLDIPIKVEHSNMFGSVLYTTHRNMVIDVEHLLSMPFSLVDVDIRANGILQDNGTWEQGNIFAGFYWQFSLINNDEADTPHVTRYVMQGALPSHESISYVQI